MHLPPAVNHPARVAERIATLDLISDGRGMRIRHIARFCAQLGLGAAHFIGNSMGAINLLVDATSESPLLGMRSLVAICGGGGEIQRNRHMEALYDYDASPAGMRRIVEALFHDPRYPADEACVARRYESSIAPGAWEALAAARFRRPGAPPRPAPSSDRAYQRVTVPALIVEGACDKLLPPGWAKEIAGQLPQGSYAIIERAGHCPQLERPDQVNALLLDFLATFPPLRSGGTQSQRQANVHHSLSSKLFAVNGDHSDAEEFRERQPM
jgi:pimeloyl-ACP methyl ester carboxylesterase